MAYNEELLTGNARYRPKTRWFGEPLMVLQVEVKTRDFTPGEMCSKTYTYFRDAKVEDLSILSL
jgi:hypothetical protein